MSAIELTAVLLAVVALVTVAILALVCARLVSITRELRRALDEVTRTVAPAAIDLRDAADRASGQVDRLDDLVRTTGHITETVDTATQVTFRALANPVIKGAAIASGTSRAARRLRGRESGRDGGREPGQGTG
ncbi:MAG TPA: hypothetical protein VJM33_07980 [Microthrixaceae bacterium]|nr:hypothetical protein [Microthrixaceae bacterium]